MRKAVATILSKDGLLRIFKHEKRPLRFEDLQKAFDLSKNDKKPMRNLLREMIREGLIVRLKNNRFGIPQEMNLRTGTLWCTRSGNGFVVPDKEGERDIFVSSRYIKDAFHGDKVVVRVEHAARGRKEGKIIKVTERKLHNVVGFMKIHKNVAFLVPEDERISRNFLISGTGVKKLKDGDLAAARITSFPDGGREPECRITKVFSDLSTLESISQFVEYKHNLPMRFRKGTESDAEKIDPLVPADGRLDLRDTAHVTIDGEFAKDFDDAVYVEKGRKGYTLYVSIADVSHYVEKDSRLDREAYERGTSIYFPGKVLPMLPKALSNGTCSLKPDEDRLTVTAVIQFTRSGDVSGTAFHKSIIRSAARLTYRQVEDAIVKKDRKARSAIRPLIPMLARMADLARLIAGRREEKGSLDFDLPEPEVLLDIEGGIKDILRTERLFSHRIIEEFMIAANEAVARFLSESAAPAVYRIHEPPEKEKLRDLEKLLDTFAIPHRGNIKDIKTLKAVLDTVKDKEYEFLINRVLLRSMKQARYSTINKGHFGLASDCYLHFTSPIRRYPDLICHRALKGVLTGGLKYKTEKELDPAAVHLSERERIAMDAERELEDRIKVLFMKDKIGEEYEGIITHITSYGIFVEPFDVFVEGIALLSELYDDYYLFQEDKYRLIGRRTKKVYRIGDRVRIKVVLADVEKNLLHFAFVR
ncbi:MAG: ribonuclease R [Syntrophobacterales bacterium]|jgi:ribonuclease R|nr:ribonuclease R [Syntrophobacterales bacterium]